VFNYKDKKENPRNVKFLGRQFLEDFIQPQKIV